MNGMNLYMLLAGAAALPCAAQSEVPDTTKVAELDEIVVQAPKVIHKADMDVLYPSVSAVENSKNGLQLLSNLMIPMLNVSDALGTIRAAGESVQVRINGRESTIDQVRALLPETIKRVEWIDNPGLRYGGASYVLNFIVTNPTVGGSLQTQIQPSVNVKWGSYWADAKFNHGLSQWSVGANVKVTEDVKGFREYTETFTYPDGRTLTRDETPVGGKINNTFGSLHAGYSYIKPDKTVFMAELTDDATFTDRVAYDGRMALSDGSPDLLLSDVHGDTGHTPSLSVYLQHNLPHNQMLVGSAKGSLYFGHSFSDYVERMAEAGITSTPVTDIRTDIHDRNQAYAIETDYMKHWANARFTAGISYTANRNRSEYDNLDGSIFHQRQDKVYFFAEYFRRFGRWTATAGMGLQYTDFLFCESKRGNNSWNPRPQATVTYSINRNHNLRLNFTSWQSTPTLAETNTVPQQIDAFQWRVGNQDLKTANSYMLTLQYNFMLPRVYAMFGVRAFSSPNAITPYIFWQEDKLITSYENSHGLRNVSLFLAPQIEIIPDWLMAGGYLQWRAERMQGTGYRLHNSAWSGHVDVRLSHWGFTLSGQYICAQRDLWGEQISWGEDINVVHLSYNWKAWEFGAGVIMPFGRYDQGSKSLCKWNRNEKHTRLDMRVGFLSLSYNLQWGRQKRGADRLINPDATTDRSTAGGR